MSGHARLLVASLGFLSAGEDGEITSAVNGAGKLDAGEQNGEPSNNDVNIEYVISVLPCHAPSSLLPPPMPNDTLDTAVQLETKLNLDSDLDESPVHSQDPN